MYRNARDRRYTRRGRDRRRRSLDRLRSLSLSRSRSRSRSLSRSRSFSRSPSRSSSSDRSTDSHDFIDPSVKQQAASVSSKCHSFGETPHDKALYLIKNMGHKNRPKTWIKLQNALRPVLTAVAYTPLDIVLEVLKKNHPDLVNTQFAVALEHVTVKRLSDVEKEVINVALSESRKISRTCPVQIVPPWSSEAKPAIKKLKQWVQGKGKEDVLNNISTLVKMSVTVGSADPVYVILQNLVKCGLIAADDQFQNFQVSTCDPVTHEWLKKYPRNYARACKSHTRDYMQGLVTVDDLVTQSKLRSRNISLAVRPESVPALLHLLSVTKRAPNKVFKRDEILAAISSHSNVVYATSPACIMPIKVKDPKGPTFGKCKKTPSRKRNVELFNPRIQVSSSNTPQFVSLRYKELFPSARSKYQKAAQKERHDQDITQDHNFRYMCEERVKYLRQKRSASVIVGREDYAKQHANNLAEFLRSKSSLDKRVQVGGCEIILTGMSRAEFLRTAMRCCMSVEHLSAADLVCSLQVSRALDVGANELIQYWF